MVGANEEATVTAETTITYAELNAAYWAWIEANCPYPKGKERNAWLKANPFVHNGVAYVRDSSPMRSNSGKTVVAWSVWFRGPGGVVISNEVEPNRRNDANRNWGLGRE